MLAGQPFSDAIFVFGGIDWLRWFVGSAFFLLGLFAGWWQWRYRRMIIVLRKRQPPQDERLKLQPAGAEDLPDGGEFGPVYEKKPEDTDDLEKIQGIGKALRAKLYDLGIFKFEQIANWNDSHVAAVEKKLQLVERIEKDGWRKQAREFLESD